MPETPPGTPAARFDAVLLVSAGASAQVAGVSLLERAAFTMVRAGASRLLCLGTRPSHSPRLPPVPVSWVANTNVPALGGWYGAAAGVIVAMDATTVVDRDTVVALVNAPQRGCLRADGPGLLWRCDPAALPALLLAAIRLSTVLPAADGGARGDVAALPGTTSWAPPAGALLIGAGDATGRAVVERALYARLGRPGESWFNRVIDRRLSRALTRSLLPSGVTPNQITCASIGLGIAAGVLFATGHPGLAVTGALFFLLSTIVDGCDGEIARLTFRESPLGARLDVIGDNVVHLFLFGGIAAGLHRRSPEGGFAILGGLLVGGAVLAMATVYLNLVRRQPTAAQRALFEWFASREFSYLLVALTLAGRLEWFLWIATAGTYAFLAGLLVLGRHGRLMPTRKMSGTDSGTLAQPRGEAERGGAQN